jgi:hypothetical protein
MDTRFRLMTSGMSIAEYGAFFGIGHHPFPEFWSQWTIPETNARICGAALVAASKKPSSAQMIACQTRNPRYR